ncbi:MAG: rhamnulokinase [Actinobacteria bacterium]|nr:rhamnulokinase [Actinomycetota bacterium]
MKSTKKYLAVDFGASNGRAIIGKFDGSKLFLEEIHRFENRPVYAGGTLYWDLLRLFSELKIGVQLAAKKYSDTTSLGIDTWGLDFGLLDEGGTLLSNPVHYRDKRTSGILDKVFELVSAEEIYHRTQAVIWELNSLYQIYAMRLSRSPILGVAKHFLFMGDLFNYFLTGSILCEYTNATASQMLDQRNKVWATDVLKELQIPQSILPKVSMPGTFIGNLNEKICIELDCHKIPVILSAYDTASEIAAIPVTNSVGDWVYICCGTWTMIGIGINDPIVSNEAFLAGFGNEGGVEQYHFLTNIVGLWIIQQCRKKWMEGNGKNLSWDEVVDMAKKSDEINTFINVDDPVFNREIFDMPAEVIDFSKRTGQKVPRTVGEIARCVYESLVLKYAKTIKDLSRITGKEIKLIHLVGGGSKNSLLCQWTSNVSGRPVIAGPTETTINGNLLVQMIASGEINSVGEGREIIKYSSKLEYFDPQDLEKWNEKLDKYEQLFFES